LAELQSLESCDPLSPDALLRLGLLLSSCQDDAITRLRSDLQEVSREKMAQADRPLALQLGMRQSSRPAPRVSSSGPLP
jgi:hypothetical protein